MSVNLINTLLRDMDTLSRMIHAIYESQFKRYELHKGQFVFISRICENPNISFAELARLLKMDKTTVTKAVDKLINSNFIIKHQNNQDRRMWHLNLTTKGLATYDNIISEKNRIIQMCLNDINEEDVTQITSLINSMLNNLTPEWDEIMNVGIKKVKLD
jgi:DNA-binding MarR family transcriptional regulator